MRELSEATMDLIDGLLAFALRACGGYDEAENANTYRAALAEFRAWREYMAQRRSFAAGNVAIDRAEREAREKATEPNPFAAAFGAFPDLPLPEEEGTEPGCETCGGFGGLASPTRCRACKGTGKREGGEHG